MESLESVLREFGDKVNAHPRLRRMLAGWDRDTLVRAVDTGATFLMKFADSRVTEIVAAPEQSTDVDIRADEAVLRDVFSGRENPAQLFLDGTLQVYASDRDQVKLDAITMVLWD
jgi:hypothetical protein